MPQRVMRFIIIFLSLHALAFAGGSAGTLRIAYPVFPPFHWERADGSLTGFFHEIITEALDRRLGVHTDWRAYPWTRCQENLKSGISDAILTVPTPKRLQYAETHPDPFYRENIRQI